MPTPQNYSFIAIAVSAALASMVFPSQAAWVDVDSLPSSGLVSQLPPELQAIIPAQASTGFTKVGTFISGTPAPSRFMAMASRLMGRARRRLNTLSRLFKTAGREVRA